MARVSRSRSSRDVRSSAGVAGTAGRSLGAGAGGEIPPAAALGEGGLAELFFATEESPLDEARGASVLSAGEAFVAVGSGPRPVATRAAFRDRVVSPLAAARAARLSSH